MTTATAATRWEPDVQATCDHCLEPASARHLRRLTVRGLNLDLCTVCLMELARRDVIDRAIALRRLARRYATAAA